MQQRIAEAQSKLLPLGWGEIFGSTFFEEIMMKKIWAKWIIQLHFLKRGIVEQIDLVNTWNAKSKPQAVTRNPSLV